MLIAIKYGSDKTAVMMGFLIGGLISIFLRVVSFTSHGKFTKKAFSVILDDLINLNVNLFDNKFGKFEQKSLLHISKLKELFSLKSVQFKDQNLIKNHSRALFYLYKCEEILHLLSIVRVSYKQIKDDKIMQELQDEISLNLKNLKLLFLDKDVKLKNRVFLKLKEENKEVIPSFEILYHTFNLFYWVEREKLA